MYPVAIYVKDVNTWGFRILKPVVKGEVGVEGSPVLI